MSHPDYPGWVFVHISSAYRTLDDHATGWWGPFPTRRTARRWKRHFPSAGRLRGYYSYGLPTGATLRGPGRLDNRIIRDGVGVK